MDTFFNIIIRFFDEQGGELLPFQVIQANPGGEAQSTPPQTIGTHYCVGYRVDEGDFVPETSCLIDHVDRDHTIVFYYCQEGIYHVTQRYIGEAGEVLHPEQYFYTTPGDVYLARPVDVPGYRCVSTQLNDQEPLEQAGIAVEVSGTLAITFRYSLDREDTYVRIITQYRDQDGQEIFPDIISRILIGQTLHRDAPAIVGYSYSGYRVDGGELKEKTEVYIPNLQQDTVVRYEYKKGSEQGGTVGCCGCCCPPVTLTVRGRTISEVLNIVQGACLCKNNLR